MACGHQLTRVVIAQLAKVESAAPCDGQGFIEQGLGVQRGQGIETAQVPLAIGVQVQAGFGHRDVMADGGHGVLQGTTAARMHVHITAGDRRNLQAGRQLQALFQMARIVLPAVQVHRQPQALGEGAAQPLDAGLGVAVLRYPQRQQTGQRLLEVFLQQAVAALFGAASGQGDQAAQVLVTAQVFHQQHQCRPVLDAHFTADNQRQFQRLGCLPGAHDARQRAFVGDRQGAVALAFGAFEQLQRTGGTALEAEVGQAMQLGVTHACLAPVGASLLAKNPRAPHSFRCPALSLTTFASKLAPTEGGDLWAFMRTSLATTSHPVAPPCGRPSLAGRCGSG
ncbi:hypothetical protein [Pseudomonas sp. 24 E 13]|nr:hypothetical protein [Pseudomonas sp. 24 E 13]